MLVTGGGGEGEGKGHWKITGSLNLHQNVYLQSRSVTTLSIGALPEPLRAEPICGSRMKMRVALLFAYLLLALYHSKHSLS